MEHTATRERLLQWVDPLGTTSVVRGMSGLEAMRGFRDGRFPLPPIAVLMNLVFAEAEEGRMVFEARPGEEHYNPIGSVHGGFAMTLMDSAMGCAVHTVLPAGVGYATTDVQIRLIRGMTKDTGVVRCEGVVVHVGRTTAVAEAKLYDRDRKLLGASTAGCAIIRPS